MIISLHLSQSIAHAWCCSHPSTELSVVIPQGPSLSSHPSLSLLLSPPSPSYSSLLSSSCFFPLFGLLLRHYGDVIFLLIIYPQWYFLMGYTWPRKELCQNFKPEKTLKYSVLLSPLCLAQPTQSISHQVVNSQISGLPLLWEVRRLGNEWQW